MYHKGQKLGEIWGYVTDGYILDDFEAKRMNHIQNLLMVHGIRVTSVIKI